MSAGVGEGRWQQELRALAERLERAGVGTRWGSYFGEGGVMAFVRAEAGEETESGALEAGWDACWGTQ
ncbi:MAG: hypothetical protein U0324_07915 [Polyangiales bacterium]